MSGQFEAFAKKRKTEDVFTVYINECEKKQIRDWVKMKPDIETGGDLFGLWIDAHTAVVQFVLGPGEKCSRTTVSFFQDVEYLQKAGNELTKHHGLCNIGQWHSHHKLALSEPSAGDHNTVWNNMPTLGLERYIVFIANITRSYDVTVNCFLFEIKDGQQLPVKKGCWTLLKGESPLRLNKQLQERVNIGAESLNAKEEAYDDLTKSEDRKPEHENQRRLQNEPKAEVERISAGDGESVISNNGSKNDFLTESSQSNTIATNTETSAKPTITPVEKASQEVSCFQRPSTGQKNGDNHSGKKHKNNGKRIPLSWTRNKKGKYVLHIKGNPTYSSTEHQAQERQQQQAAASPPQQEEPPQKQLQPQTPQPPKYENKEREQNQTETEAGTDSTNAKEQSTSMRESIYENYNPATDPTRSNVIKQQPQLKSTLEPSDGYSTSKDDERDNVQGSRGYTTSDIQLHQSGSMWERIVRLFCGREVNS